MDEPLIRDISDTARWVAVYRARETERPDAVFRDPFARALAGERGEQIARSLKDDNMEWSVIARTHAFDRLLLRELEAGTDVVVNLAAGLDARPYRLDLPPSLRWIEVDLPEILEYKERILADAQPRCRVERVALDLSNQDARAGFFGDVGRRASRVVVISEGLVIYLMADAVGALARDLAGPPSFQRWLLDIVSPGLLTMINERAADLVRSAGAPFLFGPQEGPAFFERYGWTPLNVRSLLKTAASLKRLPMFLRMMAMLPEGPQPAGSRPWSGVCLLGRA
ncbi:MAG TPA: SAM-dependent methyltransferase [Vicinamibacterales bacterium]|jgi:methyltransferase (TIGR00027 family)